MKPSKRLYLVKKEVWATSAKNAMTGKGNVYCVELADERFQIQPPKTSVGFKRKDD